MNKENQKLKKVLLVEHTWPEFVNSRLKFGISLIEKGIEVHALLPNKDGVENLKSEIEEAGVKIFVYDYEKNTTSIFSNIRYVRSFRSIFSKNNYDIIHSFKFQPNFYTVLGSLFSIDSKIVLHITGLGIVFAKPTTFKKNVLKFISKLIFFFNFLFVHKIIFQNDDDQKDLWLTKSTKKKSCVIEGSGVDIERFDKSNNNVTALRKKLGIENKLVISFISRLVAAKGVGELVMAVERLLSKYPDILLLIVGSVDKDNPDSLSEEFISKYRNHTNIRFLGYRKDTQDILGASDFYAYPSYYREGVPRTVLEALATGLPVITTNMPGCKLTVINNVNGYLIEPRSVDEVERAIEKLILNHDRTAMGAESRNLALSKFQNSVVYDKIYKVYQELNS